MKKRILSVLLGVLVLLSSAFSLAETADGEDVRLQALSALMQSGFSAEYGDEKNRLTRWTEEILIYAGGDPTQEDLFMLDDFIGQLNSGVENLPLIRRVPSRARANITMYFVPLSEMARYVSGYVDQSLGMVTYWYLDDELYEAEIGIVSDVTTQEERNHLIQEELVNGLGLGNDQTLYENSIIYQYAADAACLTDIDWLMLKMLYSELLSPGMSADDAWEILYKAITEDGLFLPEEPGLSS